MNELQSAAKNVVSECMDIKRGESVLIIIDDSTRDIGYCLWNEAKNIGAEVMIIEMLPRNVNGEEPPKAIAEAMKNVDVVIAPTLKSISHTMARRNSNLSGARIATMPGITNVMMKRTLNADYKNIENSSMRLLDKLKNAKDITLTTSGGTNITMCFEGKQFDADTGIIRDNDFGNLPGGEVCTCPIEGTSNGIVVVDGSMSGIGVITTPIKLTVKDGFVVKIDGGEEAKKLKDMLDKIGKNAYNIAELGIGTNEKAMLTGNALEDEKVLGTVHVAVGNNISYGGTIDVPIHLDGIIKNPTLIVDGKTLILNGKHILD